MFSVYVLLSITETVDSIVSANGLAVFYFGITLDVLWRFAG